MLCYLLLRNHCWFYVACRTRTRLRRHSHVLTLVLSYHLVKFLIAYLSVPTLASSFVLFCNLLVLSVHSAVLPTSIQVGLAILLLARCHKLCHSRVYTLGISRTMHQLVQGNIWITGRWCVELISGWFICSEHFYMSLKKFIVKSLQFSVLLSGTLSIFVVFSNLFPLTLRYCLIYGLMSLSTSIQI